MQIITLFIITLMHSHAFSSEVVQICHFSDPPIQICLGIFAPKYSIA